MGDLWPGGEVIVIPWCKRCEAGKPPFEPTPDTAEWAHWKLTDESWDEWRRQNPDQIEALAGVARNFTDPKTEG